MKAKETKNRSIRTMLLLATAVFAFVPLQAQKLIKKELQTENNTKDGFQYQWYKYTYVLGKDTLEAAYDMNGNRITPNGYKTGKCEGCYYHGGGMFAVYSKNRISFGKARRLSAYNVKGECVIPETNQDYFSMYYEGNGFFKLTSVNILGQIVAGMYDYKGNCIISETEGFNDFSCKDGFIFCDHLTHDDKNAVYDLKGNCIISEEWGFKSIYYDEKSEFFRCEKEDSHGEKTNYTFSKDGNYYAEGYYGDDGKDYRGEKFENNKRRVPNRNNNSTAKVSSSSNNSSTSSNNGTSNLLYEGEYTIQYSQSQELSNGYFVGQNTPDETVQVKIYEDHVTIHHGTDCKYKSTNSNGERVYEGSGIGTVTIYVSPSFNIRLVDESWVNGMHMKVSIPVVKGRSLMPDYSGGYGGGTSSGYQQSGNNGSSSGKSSGSSHQVKKPHADYKDCHICHGSGVCSTCNGKGWYYNSYGTGKVDCPNCSKTGKCRTCNGTGKVLGSTKWD